MEAITPITASYFGEPAVSAWASDRFLAHAYEDCGTLRLSVERKDGHDGITWDELQQVKNDCGFADQDAIEFYPAQADVINTGNVRHLYVFPGRLMLIKRKT